MASHSELPEIFAGFDGGGSTTRVLLATADGRCGGRGLAGASNPNLVGLAAALTELKNAYAEAWRDAALVPRPVAGAFLGLAGVASFRRSNEISTLTDWIARTDSAKVEIDHDLGIALAGALAGKEGIIVIAGTGSAAFGQNHRGETAQAGGLGPLLDDVGSGYWLGLQALRHTVKAVEGRAAPSALSLAIQKATQGSNAAQLLQWLNSGADRTAIATLARSVLQAADEGDNTAQRLVREGAADLVELARAIARKLFPRQPALVSLAGGLSLNPGYSAVFQQLLKAAAPPLSLAPALYPPVVGAWIKAAQGAGFEPSRELLQNLATRG